MLRLNDTDIVMALETVVTSALIATPVSEFETGVSDRVPAATWKVLLRMVTWMLRGEVSRRQVMNTPFNYMAVLTGISVRLSGKELSVKVRTRGSEVVPGDKNKV